MSFNKSIIKTQETQSFKLFKPKPKPLYLWEEKVKVILLLDVQLTSNMTMIQTLDTSMPPRPCHCSFLAPYADLLFLHRSAPILGNSVPSLTTLDNMFLSAFFRSILGLLEISFWSFFIHTWYTISRSLSYNVNPPLHHVFFRLLP